MASYSPTIYLGDGSTTAFNFSFESTADEEIKVKVDNAPTSAFTISNYNPLGGGTVTFITPPVLDAEICIYRSTDLDAMVSTFVPASSIRAYDLNADFIQLRNAIQENRDHASTNDADITALEARVTVNEENIATNTANIAENADDIQTNTTNIAINAARIAVNTANIATNTSDIAALDGRVTTNEEDIATNTEDIAALDVRVTQNESDIADNTANFANYWRKGTETVRSDEDWTSTNGKVPTTAAVNDRINSQIIANYTTQTYTASSDKGTLTLSPGGDTTEIPAATTSDAGLLSAADKQKLDQIEFNTRKNTVFTTSFDGVSTEYTLQDKSAQSAFELTISVGGILQQPLIDYTYNTDSGVVTFASAPPQSTPYFVSLSGVLTADNGSKFANLVDYWTSSEVQDKLDLAETSVDAKFDQLRVAIEEATDFNTLKARLLAVLQ